jgi:DNA polymerase III sliding clamp (beta) subunit (PCNA family)
MIVRIQKSELKKSIVLFKKVIRKGSEFNSDRFLKIVADKDGSCQVMAVDRIVVFVTVELKGVKIEESGKCYINLAVLEAVCKRKGDLIVISNKDKLVVENGKIKIVVKEKQPDSFFEVPSLADEKVLEVVVHKNIDISDLEWVSKSMSVDGLRPNINGVWFMSRAIFSTDGHRLHKISNSCVTVGKKRFGWFGKPIILAPKVISLLLLLKKDEISITSWCKSKKIVNKKQCIGPNDWKTVRKTVKKYAVQVEVGNWKFVVPEYDVLNLSDPPPYDQVIPKKFEFEYVFDAKEVERLSKLICDFSDKRKGFVFHRRSVECTSSELGVNEIGFSSLKTTWPAKNKESIRLSGEYFSDVVCGHDKKVFLRWIDCHEPLLVKSGDKVAVVMPVRK